MAESSIKNKILNRKKDPLLQKKLDSEQINFDADEDEVASIVEKSSLKTQEVKARKRRFWVITAMIAVPILGYLIFLLFQPFKSDMRFGFCRVFLELHVQYPQKLVLSTVKQTKDFTRIWYMQTDSFGQERMENIECYHARTPERGFYIKKININRREIDPEVVERFNTSIPAIRAYPPDLTYPRRLTDALGNIDIQTYLFRKPIFNK